MESNEKSVGPSTNVTISISSPKLSSNCEEVVQTLMVYVLMVARVTSPGVAVQITGGILLNSMMVHVIYH